MEQLKQQLVARSVPLDQAFACSQLFTTIEEALKYIGGPLDLGSGYKSNWQEYYSQKYQRFYYCNDKTGANSWDIPGPVQLRDWMIDADLYGVSIKDAYSCFKVLHHMLEANWHTPERLWEAVGVLHKMVGNIVQCGNSIEKFRVIRKDNPKVQDKVQHTTGATDVLQHAGFKHERDTIVFPEECDLKVPSLVASKLAQLLDRKGFTGSAKPVDDINMTASTSKYSGQPGFRYQQEIYECSICSHPINDGSERLFSKSHDAPKGEFRYECQSCQGLNLCESCWDKMLAGDQLHDASHSFQTHHPRMAQHNPGSSSSSGNGTNPWGVALGVGASAARSRQKLWERYGMGSNF